MQIGKKNIVNTSNGKYKRYFLYLFCFFSFHISAQIFVKDSAQFFIAQGTTIVANEIPKKGEIFITKGTVISNPELLANSDIHYIHSIKARKKNAIAKNEQEKSNKKHYKSTKKDIENISSYVFKKTPCDTFVTRLQEKNRAASNRENIIHFYKVCTAVFSNSNLDLSNQFIFAYQNKFYNNLSHNNETIRPPPPLFS